MLKEEDDVDAASHDNTGGKAAPDDGAIDPTAAEAIVGGRHKDAFAILGMHKHDAAHMRVTVFLPGADAVDVVTPGGQAIVEGLARCHPEGLFSGLVARKSKNPYRLLVRYGEHNVTIDDPYQYPSLLDNDDLYLFNSGVQEQAYRFLGANHRTCHDVEGVLFAVWAPNASRVSLVCDANHWDGRVHVMRFHPASGVWDIFMPGAEPGMHYKYEILDPDGNLLPLKADPYARRMQLRPDNASIVPDRDHYAWGDEQWLAQRRRTDTHDRPVSIYEVHLGSWKRDPENTDGFIDYRRLARELVADLAETGFTHVELMPVSEYPFDASWGYQPLGMYAPTSRFGTPDDFRAFIDILHQAGIGVLLDWVPGHFPTDEHGLGNFDGTHLYEHAHPYKGFHPDWNTLIYNYGRSEVCSYLISNALYWLREFHLDGLRIDAVASMLYLDYSRQDGQWIPNPQGGRENLEAIALLQAVTSRAYFNFPGIMMIAEESTAWNGVTRFVEHGGLGFGYKWNMGWMNDSLSYMARDPVYRKFHHHEMTFSMLYTYSENYILPLSHDEVVHGKRSLLEKMPGDDWQKFANLRAYYTFMWTHPGKKLLFMGDEIAQRDEWQHDKSIDWHLLQYEPHLGIRKLVGDLNALYRRYPALYEADYNPAGFEWLEANDCTSSVFVFMRRAARHEDALIVAVNLTPSVRSAYRVGVPGPGHYAEVFNSNSEAYGGTGLGNLGGVEARAAPSHGRDWSVELVLPPLAAVILACPSAATGI